VVVVVVLHPRGPVTVVTVMVVFAVVVTTGVAVVAVTVLVALMQLVPVVAAVVMAVTGKCHVAEQEGDNRDENQPDLVHVMRTLCRRSFDQRL
jgi:hypothetical protein